MNLADLTWPTVPTSPLVLVPVGSTEQHGPHLPFDTDTAIAVAVADAVAVRLDGDVVVAPPLAYGSSGEHQGFAGTSSIGTDVLQLVVIELVRSMSSWAGRIVFVNAHGGNVAALSKAVFQIAEQHDVAWLPCATEGFDLHAGRTETSLMLHLRPEVVRSGCAEPGDTRPLAEILPAMLEGGLAAVSPNGVLGDPRGAHAAEGAHLLDTMATDIVARLTVGTTNSHGMLRPPVAAVR
jgi:mycofactocin system creatininase family protein